MILIKPEYVIMRVKKLKSYENYRLIYDGHVENMRYNPQLCSKLKGIGLTIFNKNFYDLSHCFEQSRFVCGDRLLQARRKQNTGGRGKILKPK
jgi:hypothetical protein